MRVAYRTFGCKANQYDTERMRQELEARGGRTVTDPTEAEICVINTCTVTNQADAEARSLVRRLRRENPDLRMVVAGCSAALRPVEYRGMEGVIGVIPGHDPVDVALAAVRSSLVPSLLPLAQLATRSSLDRLDHEPVGAEILTHREGATRGWLKVQDGCDRQCSFCATRLARGVSRSRTPHDVVAEAKVLAATHSELVITGIHIGHYGLDLEHPSSLGRLLQRLLEEVPEVRFRLGSVEATEIDDHLVELLEGGGRIAPHLHMPLQSGADPVLRRMRRWHTREMYRRRALDIAGRVSPLGLGADIITGFPGETAEDHVATLALVEELPFTYLHVFPFSPRDGTIAATLPDPVAQRVAGDRSREIREVMEEKGRAYRAGRIGGPAEVVIEGGGRRGLTGDYLRVAIRREGEGPGESGEEDGKLRGRMVRGILDGSADDLAMDLPRSFHSLHAS